MDNMSVFNDDGTTDQVQTPSVEELLVRLANKDQFIEQLKGENAGLREDLGQRQGAEDLFKRIVENKPEPQHTPVEVSKEPDPKPVENPEDLTQKIQEVLNAEREQETARNNVETVINRLLEVYGDESKVEQVVDAKARELGVSKKFLQDVAARSPKAFFSTLGLDASQPATIQAPRGEINTAALKPANPGTGTFGTKEYFDNLRRENPAEYWSPKVQNQIFKAAQEGTYKV